MPVVTHETRDGCDNVLAPPRALKSLSDGARWLVRTGEQELAHWAAARRNRVLWRGAATGQGPSFSSDGRPVSTRARAVQLSAKRPELLDARFAGRDDDLRMTDRERMRVRQLKWGADGGASFLTWREMQQYRAVLILDGNTVADRLPFTMFTMTAVLKQESPLREAWYSQLVPYVHYVPVRHDLSDLEAQLAWALSNTSRLFDIARNGALLALRHLSRRAQLCHWSGLLRGLAALTTHPVEVDPKARQIDPTREFTSTILGQGTVLHEPFATAPSTLRPQLTHRPPRLSDIREMLHISLTRCLETTRTHLCLDL